MQLRGLLTAALVLSAQATAETPTVPSPPDKHWAVWVSPTLPAVYLPSLFDDAPQAGTVVVPIGASFALTPRWNVVAEMAYLRGWGGWWGVDLEDGRRDFEQIAFAVGAQFSLTGSGGFSGLFLMPKLIGAHWWDKRLPWNTGPVGAVAPKAGTVTEVQVGVDFGYQVHWKSLYFATFVGLSAGYRTGAGGFAGPTFTNSSEAGPGFVYAPNLNFFRVGATF
jgi:hypothetical protein